ncbi:MAG TPA: DUF397 domain-containing protein [Pseudonocardiaceae bacterium]|nr:DUF397 domain-containing protein [Pseudonocardiaceae bacterium]
MRTDSGASPGEQPRWRKAGASNPSGNCVEIAVVGIDRIGVRNSRHPDGAVLAFSSVGFHALLIAARCDVWDAGPKAKRLTGGVGRAVTVRAR